ncbi:MAG: tRNA lysidine(34) synthetase TilS [Flavobacteriales bacterium]|nr:tRNA lysidine(34) synthetase TilS [Flavobacteriales bacterium]
MKSNFLEYIDHNYLFRKDSKIVLAISGGIDSICLADLLIRSGYNIEFAHCNFNLRGKESDEDLAFVQQLATKYTVPFHTTSFSTNQYATEEKISLQMAAREQRYAWLEKIRKNISADYIAVAHNYDDNIETFLINIIRGTGIKGMLGINNKNKYVVRPLIFATRDMIVNYVNKYSLEYREDSSNISDKYLRNNIRHNLVPLLKEMNPSISKTISREIDILDKVYYIYKNSIQSDLDRIITKHKAGFKILKNHLAALSPPEVYIYEVFHKYGFNDIESIAKAINKGSGLRFFSSSHQLLIDREYLFLEPIDDSIQESCCIEKNIACIDAPLKMQFAISDLLSYDSNQDIAYLDKDKLIFPLKIRKWEDGDKFIPLGMDSFKKISDFFIDIKLDVFSKEKVFILCSGKDIVWIIGYRIDDRYKITSKTKKTYIATLLKDNL